MRRENFMTRSVQGLLSRGDCGRVNLERQLAQREIILPQLRGGFQHQDYELPLLNQFLQLKHN